MAVKDYTVIIQSADGVISETVLKSISPSRLGQILKDLAEKGQAVELTKVDKVEGSTLVTTSEKSTWNAKQNALGFTPENASNKNVANGYAGLGSDGKIPSSQLPSIALTDTFVAGSESAMLSLVAQTGDICVRTDQSRTYILKGTNAATLGDWVWLQSPTGGQGTVTSVNNKTGDVVVSKSDIGLGSVDNTSDADKPISSAAQAALNAKANSTHAHSVSDVSDFASSVRELALTGLSLLTNAAITATDTILTSLGKLQKQITDLSSTVNRNKGVSNVSTLVSVPTTKRLVYATVTAATTLSLSADLEVGDELHIVVYNNSASAITQSLPNTGSFTSLSGASLSIPASGRVEINILCIATTTYLIRAL